MEDAAFALLNSVNETKQLLQAKGVEVEEVRATHEAKMKEVYMGVCGDMCVCVWVGVHVCIRERKSGWVGGCGCVLMCVYGGVCGGVCMPNVPMYAVCLHTFTHQH